MPTMPISSIELQEFLFSEALANVAADCERNKQNVVNWERLKRETRESFRLQRFAVMNWLLMNGVKIPGELLSDQSHPPVGQQHPDQPVQ